MVRPVFPVVHWAANGQPAQAVPKAAVPPPALAGRMGTVTSAGQVTVPAPRSIVNRSLGNRPPGATGGCTFVRMSAPAASSLSSSTPAPLAVYGDAAYGASLWLLSVSVSVSV